MQRFSVASSLNNTENIGYLGNLSKVVVPLNVFYLFYLFYLVYLVYLVYLPFTKSELFMKLMTGKHEILHQSTNELT